jgi:hypothetical protein
MKRRQSIALEGVPVPALGATSVVLGKLPRLREFISATAYEDGSPRQTGYFWFSNDGAAYVLQLFDPDSGTRLPLRAPTIDEVLQLAEAALGLDNAPWLPDRFLQAKLSQTKRKK